MGTGLDYHIIDADSHLSEDLNRVQELTDARYREFAPKMLPQGPSEVFVIGGKYLPQPPGMTWGETISPGGFRKTPRTPTKYADGDVVGFDPKARLEMMAGHCNEWLDEFWGIWLSHVSFTRLICRGDPRAKDGRRRVQGR